MEKFEKINASKNDEKCFCSHNSKSFDWLHSKKWKRESSKNILEMKYKFTGLQNQHKYTWFQVYFTTTLTSINILEMEKKYTWNEVYLYFKCSIFLLLNEAKRKKFSLGPDLNSPSLTLYHSATGLFFWTCF